MSAAPEAISPLDPDSGWLAREIAATFALSWPLVVANVAVNLMSTTDFLMLGWLSPEALGAGSLGYNLFLPIFLFGIGVVAALSPLAASMIGARGEDASGPAPADPPRPHQRRHHRDSLLDRAVERQIDLSRHRGTA